MDADIKICQSCGMPMEAAEDFGSNDDGGKNNQYCQYCWQEGKFTADVELPEFIEMQVKIAAEKLGMEESEAREVAQTVLPELGRWRAD
ncbi:MAG: zinc ribbon domain-containing protein [Minisyncoccales bacterium]